MTTENAPRYFIKRPHSFLLIGVFLLLAAVLAGSFYSAESSSLGRGSSEAVPSERLAKVSPGATANFGFASPSSLFEPLLPLPQSTSESISTFADDCTTPKSDFFLGDVVCAKATGVPVTLFPWHVLWVDPAGHVRQSDVASSNAQTEYRYTLPSTATSDVDGQTVDNRGTWRANLVRSNGAVRQTAPFTVHELANPVTDVFVQKVVHSASTSVAAGDNISFSIVIGNAGPDTALVVHLVDSVPAGGTLVQFTQNSGPQCVAVEQGSPANNCNIAAMTNGARAEFTAIYNTGSAAPGDYSTSATVSSTTTDPNSSNNTSTAPYSVTPSTGGTTCQLTCPDNITTPANTTENGQRGAHVSYPDPVATGNCGAISSTPASGSFFPVGTTTVTSTSETGGGSCTFTITVTDNPDVPTITCPPNKTATADSNCEATVDPGQPTTTGNGVTVTSQRSDERALSDPYPVGTTTITWTATNSAGSSSCAQTITVNDTTPPTITCPANITQGTDPGSCSAAVNPGTATATDNCGATVVGARSDNQPLNAPYPKGTTTITWTATDGAGNSASCTQTVTVNDTENPTVSCPAPTSASADANCQAAVPNVTSGATASDNCGAVTLTQSPAAGTMVGSGSHTITVTATDGSGNSSTCTTTFTVNDTTPPTVSCPAPTSASADANCQAPVPDVASSATASDNCSAPGSITKTQSPAAGTMVGKGPHTITVTATDAAGNSSTCTTTFTVNDTTPPAITCPANISVPNTPGTCNASVSPGVATATDNCDGTVVPVPSRSDNKPITDPFPVGTVTIHWTATDSSGNSSSCDQTVVVLDNENPTITCPANITTSTDPGACSAHVNPGTATATDNCNSGQQLTVTGTRSDGHALSDPYPKGTTTIHWTATDSSGNSSSCDQTVTVNDNEAPAITCPANITRSTDPGACSANINPGTATATDNCGTPTVTGTRSDSQPLNAPYPKGTTTITWTATDSSGNHSSCTQTITVNDTEPPAITCPANITTNTEPGTCAAHVVPGIATATDNCGVATVSGTRSDGRPLTDTYPKGTTTITWTATDSSGNRSSCTQTITVVDNEPPKITFNGNTPSMSPPDHKYHTFTPADFISSVSDNCDSLSVGDVYITKATSDEPDQSGGSGNTTPDIVIATDCKSVQLRAERMGGGNGRVYTIYFKLKDSSGNFTTGTAKVIVPVETGGTAVDDGPSFTVTSGCP